MLTAKIEARLKKLAGKYIGRSPLIRKIQTPVIMKLLNLGGSEDVLDVGCGPGYFVPVIVRRCRRYYGVDLRIPEHLKRRGNGKKETYVEADALNLPFPDESFDAVLLSSVLQMVDDDERLLRETRRVLKKNGRAVIGVPLDYLFIKWLYAARLFKGRGKPAGLPPDYQRFREYLKAKFRQKSEYSLADTLALLKKTGFAVEEYEYSPKRVGSFLYEVSLLFCLVFNRDPFHPVYLLLYALAWLDNLLPGQRRGIEVVVRARAIK